MPKLLRIKCTKVRAQLRLVKYGLVEQRIDVGYADPNIEEYRALNRFMVKTIRELEKTPSHVSTQPLREIMIPVLKIKTKRFIVENLPGYAKRLKS